MKKMKLLAILVLASVVSFAGCKKNDDGAKTYTLNVTATNGTVVKNPNQTAYNKGTNVQLTATPNSGYSFTSWSGDATGYTNPLTVTMNANKNITANFSIDNTAELQALIDQCPTNGTVSIPAGTYMINALTSLNLKSNMTLQMDSGTILKAISTYTGYGIIMIRNVSNVNVIGGTVQGDRSTHANMATSANQYVAILGFGVWIDRSSNIVIDGVTAKDMAGDGFFIDSPDGIVSGLTQNVTVKNCIADNNLRQGMSISQVNGMVVQNCVFKNTNGITPGAGIDVEPCWSGEAVNNLQILNNEFYGNWHYGITVCAGSGPITNVTISSNNIHNNGTIGDYVGFGIALDRVSGVMVSGNNVHDGVKSGIVITNAASTDNTITNNTVTNNGNTTDHNDYGILIFNGATGNTITGNIVTGNNPENIRDFVGGNTISGNTVGP